jgi:ketosteroid isomerase-like protein
MSTQPILDAGQQWANAERHMDSDALETLLDEDFAGVGPRGFVLSRQQWLDRYRSGDLKNDEFDWHDVSVREYGGAAIATGVQTQKTFYRGQEMSGHFRVSHVYVKKMNRWLIAHIQISGPIPEMPPSS